MGNSAKIHVLVVGNNPIEMSEVAAHLNELPQLVEAEFVFDLAGVQSKLKKFNADVIFLDDDLGEDNLHGMIQWIHEYSDAPITLLKTSNNYSRRLITVEEYLMKVDLSSAAFLKLFKKMLAYTNPHAVYALHQKYIRRQKKLAQRLKGKIDDLINPRASLSV